jgi:hypothetical protein
VKCVILLESVHQVLRAEKLLKGKGMEVDLVPVPREIRSDCGVALELPLILKEEAILLIEGESISILGCYARLPEGGFKPLLPSDGKPENE